MNKIYRALLNVWILLPAVPYLAITCKTVQNLPIMDDYEAVLGTVIRWKCSDFWGKMEVLFQQYNEHRILPSRLVFVVYYYVFGEINFRNLIILGDFQLLVVAAILCYFIKKTGIKYWQLPALLSVFLVFDLNTYESGSIAMYTWQNNGVLMYFFLTLLFYHKGWMWPAVLSQFLLTFSSGNGMIGSMFLVLYCRGLPGRQVFYCLPCVVTFTALYFAGYVPVDDPSRLPFDIVKISTYFIQMTGAPFSFDNSAGYGFVILCWLPVISLLWKRWDDPKIIPFLTMMFFVLASMGTASLFRACMPKAQFQSSRYLIYPQLLIAILVVFMLLKKKKAYTYSAYAIMVLWVTVYFPYNYRFGEAGFERTEYRVSTRSYWHPQPLEAEKIAKEACRLGIYSLEDER